MIQRRRPGPQTRLEAMNCEMDNLAKAFWHELQVTGHSMQAPILTDPTTWSLWHGPTKLNSPNSSVLYDVIMTPKVKDYWTSAHKQGHNPHRIIPPRFPRDALDVIDWKACERAMKQLRLPRRRWTTKHASENCGVGLTLFYWKKQDDAQCPRCGVDEDTMHVLQCQACGANDVWEENLAKLNTYLEEAGTHPEIHEAISQRLQELHYKQPRLHVPVMSQLIQQAIQDQDLIGWKPFLEGVVAEKWIQAQAQFYKYWQVENTTAESWMAKVNDLCHTLAWRQWDHRDKELHDESQPRQRAALEALDEEIEQELLRGPEDMPLRHRGSFNITLLDLLSRKPAFKKNWLEKVHWARDMNAKRKQEAADAMAQSRARSRLRNWFQTGRWR